MSFELSALWDDFASSTREHEVKSTAREQHPAVSAKAAQVEVDDKHQMLLQELYALRAQTQKKETIAVVAVLAMFAILLNHIDRLHSRIHEIQKWR